MCQVIDILDKSVIHSPWCCQSQDQDGECEEKEKSASRPHHQIDYVLQPNSIFFLVILGKRMLIIFGFGPTVAIDCKEASTSDLLDRWSLVYKGRA